MLSPIVARLFCGGPSAITRGARRWCGSKLTSRLAPRAYSDIRNTYFQRAYNGRCCIAHRTWSSFQQPFRRVIGGPNPCGEIEMGYGDPQFSNLSNISDIADQVTRSGRYEAIRRLLGHQR